MIAGNDEELVLVVEDHAERHVFYVDKIQIASVRIENLNALHVANIDTPISINSDRVRSTKLTLLIAVAAKTIYILPIAPEFEDSIVEPAERVDIPSAINRDSRR